MAYTTNTSSGALSCYNALISFLTSNGWTQAWSATVSGHLGQDIVLQAPYTGSTVLIGLSCRLSFDNSSYLITVNGMTAVVSTAKDLTGHTNPSGVFTIYSNRVYENHCGCFVDNSTKIQYWFNCNSRSFKAVFRVNGTFETLYAGLLLPPVKPSVYPLPLCVSGTTVMFPSSSTQVYNIYNSGSTDTYHTSPVLPYVSYYNSSSCSSSYMLDPDGKTWLPGVGRSNNSNPSSSLSPKVAVFLPSYFMNNSTPGYLSDGYDPPGNYYGSSASYENNVTLTGFNMGNSYNNGHNSIPSALIPFYDGTITTLDVSVARMDITKASNYANGFPDILGIMDGLVRIPGWALKPGDIVQDSSSTSYLVLNSPNNNSKNDFYGVRLDN